MNFHIYLSNTEEICSKAQQHSNCIKVLQLDSNAVTQYVINKLFNYFLK